TLIMISTLQSTLYCYGCTKENVLHNKGWLLSLFIDMSKFAEILEIMMENKTPFSITIYNMILDLYLVIIIFMSDSTDGKRYVYKGDHKGAMKVIDALRVQGLSPNADTESLLKLL